MSATLSVTWTTPFAASETTMPEPSDFVINAVDAGPLPTLNTNADAVVKSTRAKRWPTLAALMATRTHRGFGDELSSFLDRIQQSWAHDIWFCKVRGRGNAWATSINLQVASEDLSAIEAWLV